MKTVESYMVEGDKNPNYYQESGLKGYTPNMVFILNHMNHIGSNIIDNVCSITGWIPFNQLPFDVPPLLSGADCRVRVRKGIMVLEIWSLKLQSIK